MLVTMSEILRKSREGRYGVIAPNINNETTARAAIETAQELNAPVILDVIYAVNPDIHLLAQEVRYLAERAGVPVALNLDHGGTFEQAIDALRAGFSSIMVDRSAKPYEENVAEVAELVKIAHAAGVTVESELGHVGVGANYDVDGSSALTDPAQAAEYVERTGVDALAIAIGTAHGPYKGTPHIDFDRLAECYKAVDVPLVLHGGSGSGDENLARAAREGITKINVGTDLFQGGLNNLLAHYQELTRANNAYDLMAEGYKAELARYMRLVGQEGKA